MDEGNEAAAGDLLSSLLASSVQSRNILTYASVGTTFLVVQTTFPCTKNHLVPSFIRLLSGERCSGWISFRRG